MTETKPQPSPEELKARDAARRKAYQEYHNRPMSRQEKVLALAMVLIGLALLGLLANGF